MKRKSSYSVLVILITLLFVSSCRTTNDVVTKGLFQKRKYTKGFYVNSHKRSKVKPVKFSNSIATVSTSSSINRLKIDEKVYAGKKAKKIKFSKLKRVKEPDDRIAITLRGILKESTVETRRKLERINHKLMRKYAQQDPPVRYIDQETGVKKKLEVLGLVGFIAGVVSLIIGPLLFGLGAFILSVISLSKFTKYPGIYKGKGFAIAGLILGVISIIFGIVVAVSAA